MSTLIRSCVIALAAGVLAGLTAVALAQSPTTMRDGLGKARVQAIVAHGPWPQRWQPDHSNRVSSQPAAVELGRLLFFDARLSPSGRVSCSSCHRPELAWSDGRQRGIGVQSGPLNTPSLLDVRDRRRLGWSGTVDSLWIQSRRPLLDAAEMGSSAQHVKGHIERQPALAAAYAMIFGRPIAATDAEAALTDATKALAAYQETMVSGRTSFDEFRDALAAGGNLGAARYPTAAQRGLGIFVGTGGCNSCHAGPAFTDDTVRDVGRNRRIRVPTLRNVARTAPYMHDGRHATPADAIRAHAGFPDNSSSTLRHKEVDDLTAFLATLSPR